MDGNINGGVVLYGAGGHSKVVAEVLRCMGVPVSCIVDDNPVADEYDGIPVRDALDSYGNLSVSIGNCSIRRKIVEKVHAESFFTAIHPTAIIAPGVRIGEGSVICAGAIIQPGATIGRHCIINTRSVVEHDVNVGDFVHVASGATVCGAVCIGEGTWVGAGSVVKQCIKIGRDSMIGAGSVVVKDIPDRVVAYGNPCTIRK